MNRLTGVFGCLLVLCALILTAGCGSDSAGDQPTSDSSTSTLSGTTRVTLKPRTEDGRAPTDQSLDKAEQILRDRVNAFGVFGVRVESVGDTFVITIPGDARAKADTLGRAARLYIRPVAISPGSQPSSADPPAPEPQRRVFPQKQPPSTDAPTPQAIAEAKAARQSTDPAVRNAALVALDCAAPDPLEGRDDPALPLITCDNGGVKYQLEPTVIDGNEISDAKSSFNDQQGKNVVTVTFSSAGADAWAKLTRENLNRQVAFTLDTRVITAPLIRSPTPVGLPTEISGDFTADDARTLATNLKYGSLPFTLDVTEVEYVGDASPSLSLPSTISSAASQSPVEVPRSAPSSPATDIHDLSCGTVTVPQTGRQLTVVIASSNGPLECAEAIAVSAEFFATANGRVWPVRSFECTTHGAAEAEQLEYVVDCQDAVRGVKIILTEAS